MTMREKLRQIGWLKLGNVEKTIEEVEESKLEMEKNSHQLSIEQKYLEEIIREKFPQVVGNISALGEQIYGLKEDSWNFEEIKDPKTYYPSLKNWKTEHNFGLNFHPLVGWKEDYIQFSFEKETMELEEIAVNGEEIFKPFSPFSVRTVNEFCEKYVQLVNNEPSDKYKYVYYIPADMIVLLNLIPEYIRIMYKGMEQTNREKLGELKSTVNSLEELDTSDLNL